jgi:hypothetical protein
MTWLYNREPLTEIPEGMIGFVYLITNQANGMKYIGKKNFYFSKTKQVKGKKKRIKVESDWKEYYGSNKTLTEHVDLYGDDKFIREIIYLCKTKGEASYYEAKEQFSRDALLSEDYYNTWIMVRVRKTHVKK